MYSSAFLLLQPRQFQVLTFTFLLLTEAAIQGANVLLAYMLFNEQLAQTHFNRVRRTSWLHLLTFYATMNFLYPHDM